MEGRRNYSCNTAAETLDWIQAIIQFLQPYRFFFEAHVVNFFKDRLWEAVDKDWIDCLRNEPVESLLHIPSGVVREHWPTSLKEFVLTCRVLSFTREQAKLATISPEMCVTPLNSVLSQGMSLKKKHEVELLAAVISSTARSVGADTVVDVGSGQGYLAQVLCFEHQLSVVAIDASSHHGEVTNSRAERIKKHYAAQMRRCGSGHRSLNMPKTVTCRVLSASMLRNLAHSCSHENEMEGQSVNGKHSDDIPKRLAILDMCPNDGAATGNECSLVLAGLHACGDLSVTMLRTFLECREVKGIVSVACCYNLLSEDGFGNCLPKPNYGFPVSDAVKSIGLSIGKSARDLACQSAGRWRGLEENAGLENFDLHAFRAAFQMVLARYYPSALLASPSIGRQGKALRRQQQRSSLNAIACPDESRMRPDKFDLFEKFSLSGLSHLGLEPLKDPDLHGLWKEFEPYIELVGPYWSLRAALGPLLETLILLDRLLFLQEQNCSVKVVMLPIFDPVLSPRNLAIIAEKVLG